MATSSALHLQPDAGLVHRRVPADAAEAFPTRLGGRLVDQSGFDTVEHHGPVAAPHVPEAYRDLRADLARRPTMTELFHRGTTAFSSCR